MTVDYKSNEITAIPKLLDTLHLKNMIVSKIVQKRADYVLMIKENQKLLYRDMVD
ncbi:hypothetical protein [Bacillus wiedmannii]|uniref:hypothetical protein n=1 Tax=Bacillus wiedmannii TaxID=1890302 RepID=UPI0014852D3A|nr:hypothetical protein [Bacillus wiedmannii]